MASPAQLAANRQNAKKSTGPRTPKGKAIAARNATQHGLTAQDVVLQDEEAELFDEHRAALWAALDPVGELEEVLVERVVVSAWRLRRVARIEAGVFRFHVFDHNATQANRLKWSFEKSMLDDLTTTTITDEQQHAAAERLVDEAETARDNETIAIAFTNAMKRDDILAKLSRYEAAIERSLYRALHELRRLQTARERPNVHPGTIVETELAPTPPSPLAEAFLGCGTDRHSAERTQSRPGTGRGRWSLRSRTELLSGAPRTATAASRATGTSSAAARGGVQLAMTPS